MAIIYYNIILVDTAPSNQELQQPDNTLGSNIIYPSIQDTVISINRKVSDGDMKVALSMS